MEAFLMQMYQDPFKVITILLLLLVAWFIKKEFMRFEESVSNFKNQISIWENSIKLHMNETRTNLTKHSEDMGKASKAINGDILKIREHILDLKQQLITEIENVKSQSATVARENQSINQNISHHIQNFDLKYGKIVDLKSKLDTCEGKIIRLEEAAGEFRISSIKHRENMSLIAKAISKQQHELEKIKGKKDGV